MHSIVACALCGMDPGTDSLVVHSLLAAGIATPWYFRTQVVSLVRTLRRRVRGEPEPLEACELSSEDELPAG
jgi:hypothetical protein